MIFSLNCSRSHGHFLIQSYFDYKFQKYMCSSVGQHIEIKFQKVVYVIEKENYEIAAQFIL
jgi:hypothetical protein